MVRRWGEPHLPVWSDNCSAPTSTAGRTYELRAFTRRVAVVAKDIDCHRLVDERERRVILCERRLRQRFRQHMNHDVAADLVIVAVVDGVGEPNECIALVIERRWRKAHTVG